MLKLCYNINEQVSLSSFNFLIGISYCCVALLDLRFCISLENFFWISNLKENVQYDSHFVFNVCRTRVLGKFFNGLEDCISLRCFRNKIWWVWEILKVSKALLKNLQKISVTFLSFEMIFSFSLSVILYIWFCWKKVVQPFSKNLYSILPVVHQDFQNKTFSIS